MRNRAPETVTLFKLAALVAGIAVALGLGLGNAWLTLHELWTAVYGPNAHGYLVLAMGVWIAVTHWREDPPREFAPSGLALLALGACAVALAAMELLLIDSTRLVLLPPVFLLAVSAVLGWQAGRRLFWGAMFLYFALPQWRIINGPLQELTVRAVSSMLRWTDVPAHIEGNIVAIPAGTFEIASGCSGLNYLMAGLALASFVALTRIDDWRSRTLVVLVAAAGAIAFNWLRVYLVILIGHATAMQHYLVRVEHHTFGWVLFLLLLVPMIVFASRVEFAEVDGRGEPGMPGDGGRRGIPPIPWSSVWMILPLVFLLAVPRLAAWQGEASIASGPRSLPEILPGAVREPASQIPWTPRFVNADQEIVEYTTESGLRVTLFRAAYPHQDPAHRLLDGSNDLLTDAFQATGQSAIAVASVSGGLTVRELQGAIADREYVLWTWFEIGGRTAHTDLGARAAELLGRVGGRSDAAVIAVVTGCLPDCGAARAGLQEFLAAAYEQLRPVYAVD